MTQLRIRRIVVSDSAMVFATPLYRLAQVCVRQFSTSQIERNRGCSLHQCHLVDRGVGDSRGFPRMTAQVALARVSINLGLGVSRLARNDANWYRLVDLYGAVETPIADADIHYRRALLNHRPVPELEGILSTAAGSTSSSGSSSVSPSTDQTGVGTCRCSLSVRVLVFNERARSRPRVSIRQIRAGVWPDHPARVSSAAGSVVAHPSTRDVPHQLYGLPSSVCASNSGVSRMVTIFSADASVADSEDAGE